MDKAAAVWRVFGKVPSRVLATKHMIWVSSQQVVIPGEELDNQNMEEYSFLSWQHDELTAFAATLSNKEKMEFLGDARVQLPGLASFEEAVEFKFWLFGGSARRMFGIRIQEAMRDIDRYIERIDDAEKLNAGLQGVRGDLAVNHVVGRYADGVIQPISAYVLQAIAKRVGLKAIGVMYNSPWVRDNPSVHGLVFEWDIFVQMETTGQLHLTSSEGHQQTWAVDENVGLNDFIANGVTSSRMMIRPPKWNHPEYDGLYVTVDSEGRNHLIAWNASEASRHTASVHKLAALLLNLAIRQDSPISFASLRFIFIVPVKSLGTFDLPSDNKTQQAKQVLSVAEWGFTSFEVLGVKPSTLS